MNNLNSGRKLGRCVPEGFCLGGVRDDCTHPIAIFSLMRAETAPGMGHGATVLVEHMTIKYNQHGTRDSQDKNETKKQQNSVWLSVHTIGNEQVPLWWRPCSDALVESVAIAQQAETPAAFTTELRIFRSIARW